MRFTGKEKGRKTQRYIYTNGKGLQTKEIFQDKLKSIKEIHKRRRNENT